MKEVKTKSVWPTYAIALTWLIYAMFCPLYKLSHFIVAGILSFLVNRLAKKIFPDKIEYVEIPEIIPPPASYGAEIDALIKEGQLAKQEMIRLRDSIKNRELAVKINELIIISEKIVGEAIHDPADVPQIKKFLSYYLPTTIKLLNAYDRMSSQGIDGKNISGSMTRIEDMLDTAIVAYKKQLDSLFANQALDIETDIEVMNAMLAREGLSGKGFS